MSEVYIKEPNTNGKAIFRTTHGDLEIELWATECPKACRNFCQLILEGFYDNTIFHKVIKDFLVQGGDRTGTGDQSESIYGKPYPDEIHPRLKYRYRGMMGVASAGKGTNTNGSQFFILMDRAPALDGKYTLFGKVVGQTVYNLARISEVECDKKDRPIDPPRITRAELVNDPFGDLDPRRHREPPKVQVVEEPKRRAAVQNKKMLSFGDEEDEDESEEEEKQAKAPSAKLKSAHDVLEDPRLAKDMAYPDAVAERGAKRQLEAEPTPSMSSIAKRVAVAAATAASASKQKKAEMIAAAAAAKSDSDSDSDEDSDSEASGQGQVDVSKQRSLKRQEEILALKKGIAEVGHEPKEEKKSRKTSSALEELRAGYKPREKRKQATGREMKRREAQEITDTMKAFRNRLNALASMPAGSSGEEEEKKDKKEKKEKKEKKGKKDKKSKEEEPEEGTFASIWKEGDDDEDDNDWLTGGGLKFHVSADKAFKLDRDRAFKTLDIFDPLAKEGNAEVLAHARKKHSEGAIPLRRKGPPKKEERGDRERER